MPDFTVIEGGGQGREEMRAQYAFERFVLELLRALVRDSDDGHGTAAALIRFIECMREANVPLAPLLAREIAELHELAFADRGWSERDDDVRGLLRAAFKTTVENMCRDDAARARQSSRRQSLESAIEEAALEREGRARENGWSYLKWLSDRLGKWPPRGDGGKSRKR